MDRFYRGLTAGMVAGVPMIIWGHGAYYLGLGNLRFLDWAGVIIYGSLPETLFQVVYAQIAHLLWLGFLGIVFSYLIPKVTSRGHIGKAVIFGYVVGFFTHAIPVLFAVPHLAATHSQTVIHNHVGGVIWGLGLGYILRVLDH